MGGWWDLMGLGVSQGWLGILAGVWRGREIWGVPTGSWEVWGRDLGGGWWFRGCSEEALGDSGEGWGVSTGVGGRAGVAGRSLAVGGWS